MGEEGRRQEEMLFVEDVGLFFEQSGLPRMAGRILGWLLIADPPHQSPGQLAAVLQSSKGSISTMTRLLVQMGLVERVGIPGHRRDYFRIRSGGWTDWLKDQLAELRKARRLAERGLALVEDKHPLVRHRLEEIRDLYAFLEREMPALLERWAREREKGSDARAEPAFPHRRPQP